MNASALAFPQTETEIITELTEEKSKSVSAKKKKKLPKSVSVIKKYFRTTGNVYVQSKNLKLENPKTKLKKSKKKKVTTKESDT